MNFHAVPNLSQNCRAQAEQFKIPVRALRDAGRLLGSCGQKSRADFCPWDGDDYKNQRRGACAPSRRPMVPGLFCNMHPLLFHYIPSSWQKGLMGNPVSCIQDVSWPFHGVPFGRGHFCRCEASAPSQLEKHHPCSLSAVFATALLQHSCCWQNSCVFRDLPGQE